MYRPELKANASPCGAVCPRRDLPGCRRTCEAWQTYEKAQMEKYNHVPTPLYTGVMTAGSKQRMLVNKRMKNKKWRGSV